MSSQIIADADVIVEEKIHRLKTINESILRLRKESEKLTADIKKAFDSTDAVRDSDGRIIAVFRSTNQHLDQKALREKYPDIYNEFIVPRKPFGMLVVNGKLVESYQRKLRAGEFDTSEDERPSDTKKPSAVNNTAKRETQPVRNVQMVPKKAVACEPPKLDKASTKPSNRTAKIRKKEWEEYGIREARSKASPNA